MDINCEDVDDGTCRVTYCPTEPGSYIINIKFAEQHVPGTAAEVTSCGVDGGGGGGGPLLTPCVCVRACVQEVPSR